jgi:hypothetical protein
MTLNVEEIDLSALGAALRRDFDDCVPKGFVRGRTMLRDAVIEHLGCSEVEGERIVDTMIGLGFLRFEGEPTSAAGNDAAWWVISDAPMSDHARAAS